MSTTPSSFTSGGQAAAPHAFSPSGSYYALIRGAPGITVGALQRNRPGRKFLARVRPVRAVVEAVRHSVTVGVRERARRIDRLTARPY